VEVPGGTHSRLHSEAPELYRQTLHALMLGLEPPTTPQPTGLQPAAAP
jgi:hypothetical protein